MQKPYDGNTATLPTEDHNNGFNWSGQKEMTDAYALVVLHDGELREVVTVRWYMGRSRSAQTVLCSVWVRRNDNGVSVTAGTGKAGGYGYCKRSATFDDAVRSAGIKLGHDVHGSGMSTVEVAMNAIADACGYGQVRLMVRS